MVKLLSAWKSMAEPEPPSAAGQGGGCNGLLNYFVLFDAFDTGLAIRPSIRLAPSKHDRLWQKERGTFNRLLGTRSSLWRLFLFQRLPQGSLGDRHNA
jgi:hypothetical protein